MKKRIRKALRLLARKFPFTKREKFGLIVGLLTLEFLIIQLVNVQWRYPLIAFLVLTTYFLSAWGLREDLGGVEWLTLFVLPTMYAAALPLFYFLLPVRWLTRLPTAIFFALGMYAILLVENIYNVAAARTIQLLRAAHSVGFLMTLFAIFLLFSVIFSLHLPFYWNLLLVFIVSFPAVLQSLWAMRLELKIEQEVFLYTLTIALTLAELACVFSFWPLPTIIEALFLTTVFYSLVGAVQQHLVGRLFRQTVSEFMAVLLVVFILVLLAAKWGG